MQAPRITWYAIGPDDNLVTAADLDDDGDVILRWAVVDDAAAERHRRTIAHGDPYFGSDNLMYISRMADIDLLIEQLTAARAAKVAFHLASDPQPAA